MSLEKPKSNNSHITVDKVLKTIRKSWVSFSENTERTRKPFKIVYNIRGQKDHLMIINLDKDENIQVIILKKEHKNTIFYSKDFINNKFQKYFIKLKLEEGIEKDISTQDIVNKLIDMWYNTSIDLSLFESFSDGSRLFINSDSWKKWYIIPETYKKVLFCEIDKGDDQELQWNHLSIKWAFSYYTFINMRVEK